MHTYLISEHTGGRFTVQSGGAINVRARYPKAARIEHASTCHCQD
jgi:hypothetical protein